MERGWLKARIVVTKDDTGEPKIPRDSGIPSDTQVIAVVVNGTFPADISSEWAWQRCVNDATLISVDMVESSDLPVPSSPLESSTGSSSMTPDLPLHLSETIRLQYQLKNRDLVWIHPINSHPVEEVWLRASSKSTESTIDQFLVQVEKRSTNNKIIVKLNALLGFTLNNSSTSKDEIWFDVLQVLPIAQGHLTKDTKIIIVPSSCDAQPRPPQSDDESDSDEALTYDPQDRIIYSDTEASESDEESGNLELHDSKSLPPQPRKTIKSASEFRRSSLVTVGHNMHLFKCVPMYDFPAEKNFILLPKAVRERLGCYGLENLIISPVEHSDHQSDEVISLVAVVDDYKGRPGPRSVVYVHPEVYFNLFPYPLDHMNMCHRIHAQVYRPGVTSNDEIKRYKAITVAPVHSRSYENHMMSTEVLLRRYFKRDNEIYCCKNYVFSISTEFGVIYFKVVATDPIVSLGSVGLSTAVVLKTPAENSYIPDCDHLSTISPPYWIHHYPEGFYKYCEQLLSFCLPVYQRIHPQQACILISGLTGVGKATVAKAVARACRVNLIQFNCHEIVSENIPNILKRLMNALLEAKRCAPSMLLFRKLHALCKEKEASREDPRVAQWFDKIVKEVIENNTSSEYPIVIVGTSYHPEILPYRISGCFIHEVAMTTPTLRERAEILEGLSEDIVKALDVDFTDLSLKTSGLLLGDFVAITTQASQSAVDEAVKHCYPSGMSGSCDQLSMSIAGATVTQRHYDKAVKLIQEAHNDSIGAPKVPTVSWRDVGGLEAAKSEILDTIQLPLQHPEMFSEGLRRSGILLYGAPGTGKTLIAKAVATECSLNFLSVKGPELINMFVGQSEQNIREVFARAKTATPCVIFFDEIDSLAPNRGKSGDSGGVMDRIVSQLLAELDGLQSNEGIFIIGATNRPDLLDPSLLRPGRFDRLVYLDIADDVESKTLVLQALTRGIHLHADVSLQSIAMACPSNTTGADLYALCNEATKMSLRRTINELEAKGTSDEEWNPPLWVTNNDFLTAANQLRPSVSVTELENYRKLHHSINNPQESSSDNSLVSVAELENYHKLHHSPQESSIDNSLVSVAELENYHKLHHGPQESSIDNSLVSVAELENYHKLHHSPQESSSDNSSVSVAELENNRKLHLSISNPQESSIDNSLVSVAELENYHKLHHSPQESSSDNSSVSVAELENNRKLHLSISNPQESSSDKSTPYSNQ